MMANGDVASLFHISWVKKELSGRRMEEGVVTAS
jgi:hypothetical protein